MKEILRLLREIVHLLRVLGDPRIAYEYREAAAAVGISLEKLRQHIARGELVPSYIDSKPVILREELIRWVKDRPAESSRAA